MQFYFSKREMQQAEKFPLYVKKEKSSSFTFIYVREKQVEYLKKTFFAYKEETSGQFPFPVCVLWRKVQFHFSKHERQQHRKLPLYLKKKKWKAGT